MKGADKVICQAAAVFFLFALTSGPAKAQFGGFGGGDIMSMIGPMMRMARFGGGGYGRRHKRRY